MRIRFERHTLTLAVLLVLSPLGTSIVHPQRQPSSDSDEFDRWEAAGDAFAAQPVRASSVMTNRLAPVTVGGDYWQGLRYPLGQDGDSLVMSGTTGDEAVGRFSSPPFVLSSDAPYFSVLIGGTNDVTSVRLELQVSAAAGRFDAGDARAALRVTGDGYEQLRQVRWQVPGELIGHGARVVIVDESPKGHINVDAVRFSRESPQERATPVWGYADYHTHPMTHLAFGALKGVRTIWGQPGGRYSDYTNSPGLYAIDLPACITGHGGGPYASPFLNGAQTLKSQEGLELLVPHAHEGWPDYDHHPSFLQGTHEQMHVTQIRRSYDGGLRLLVALATDNTGAEYLMSSVGKDNHIAVVKEQDSLEAQLSGMKDLALLNADWMQIATTPAEARDIILHNKLAVILGIEMDHLGTYGCSIR